MMRTPLYDTHVALGAKMVDFAGWDMPLHYTGISQEHVAVRTGAGLFDVSHMGQISVLGKDATTFLSYATLNDPAKLKKGRGQYSMVPNDTGGLIDDIYIYKNDAEDYLVIANAANVAKVMNHFTTLSLQYNVQIVDASESWALLALQGPGSVMLLGRLVSDDLADLRKNSKLVTRLNGCVIDVARTGYTGEDGFEILCRPADTVMLWNSLIEAEATPCGLGARDTLRLEAGFPLFGHEFDATTNPLCSDYAWVVKDKSFYGRDALWSANCQQRLVGIQLNARGIPREGYTVTHNGQAIGTVTSGTLSPFTHQSIALAWVDSAYSDTGTQLAIRIRSNDIPATVIKPPFY